VVEVGTLGMELALEELVCELSSVEQGWGVEGCLISSMEVSSVARHLLVVWAELPDRVESRSHCLSSP
jgi:hypothetical protein